MTKAPYNPGDRVAVLRLAVDGLDVDRAEVKSCIPQSQMANGSCVPQRESQAWQMHRAQGLNVLPLDNEVERAIAESPLYTTEADLYRDGLERGELNESMSQAKTATAMVTERDELWTVDDVAAYCKVPRMTVYKWNALGEIPYFRLGNTVGTRSRMAAPDRQQVESSIDEP